VPHLCGHYPDQLCGKCSGLDRNVKQKSAEGVSQRKPSALFVCPKGFLML
jgi:hypothetical protein